MKHEQWRFDLLKAAQLIRENGLQKGQLQGPDGYCLVGAIGTATSGLTLFVRGNDRYYAAINRVVAHLGDDTLFRWSDRPERTAQEVIDLLERAASDTA
jgi:hypothetical protein